MEESGVGECTAEQSGDGDQEEKEETEMLETVKDWQTRKQYIKNLWTSDLG